VLRFAATILILGGIGAAFVWPSMVMRNSGRELVRETVFDRGASGPSAGWRSATVELTPADNPVRIVLEASFLPGRDQLEYTTPMQVSVALQGSLVVDGIFDLSMPPMAANNTVPRLSSLALPEFEVEKPGNYAIVVRPLNSGDLDYRSIGVSIRAAVRVPDDRFRPLSSPIRSQVRL
jgi:hypothetical protein